MTMNEKDTIVMKLLHYFITEENYTPVIVHGVQNEIWLENMDENYKLIRIVSNYIHNNEQFRYDVLKTKSIIKTIKKKTFNLNMNILNIFIDLGENVNLQDEKHINNIYLKDETDLQKYKFLYEYFPDIDKKLTFSEKGVSLFMKITDDINKKNKEEAIKIDNIFKPKKPIITYILIAINILVFAFGLFFNKMDFLANNFCVYGPLIKNGQFYRLLTGTFLHLNIMHLLVNMYALYILGTQAESFFGKTKFIIIYLFSAITGSMLSMLLNGNIPSVGASGAIFGILGAMLFFGYNFRVYLGNGLFRQILNVIVLNLALALFLNGFSLTGGIDIFGHIGGLAGGFLMSMALGLKAKTKQIDHINGFILSALYTMFLVYMNFFYR